MAKLILFNKPFNVLSQFTDENGRDTLKQYLADHDNVYPAGRLDYDSEGLLLLTDNGVLQHQISHPKSKQDKTYWAQVEGSATDPALQPLREGIALKDGPCRPATVRIIDEPDLWERTPPIRKRLNKPTSWLEITINEGKNRQVRRMTAAVGYPTLRLVRACIGDWTIDDLAPGEYRVLTVADPTPFKKKYPKPTTKPKRAQARRTTRRKDTL